MYTIETISIVEAIITGEPSERAIKASQLMQKATQFSKVYYVREEHATETTKIGFYSETPESLIVMLNTTTKTVQIIEASITGEQLERNAEVSHLRSNARECGKVYYEKEDQATKTTKIGFYSENPEILLLIINH